ncbi:hypothetical protein ACFL4O_02050 [bacterium]
MKKNILIIFFFLVSIFIGIINADNEFLDSAKTIFFPPDIGKITENYSGANNGRLILIIQNIHCHSYVQKKIEHIIKIFKRFYSDDLKIIGVEGDVGYINTSLLGDIPDDFIKRGILNDLLDKSLITGYESYHSMFPLDIKLYGLEDWNIYSRNMKLLKDGVIRYNGWLKEYENCINWFNSISKKSFSGKIDTIIQLENSYKKNMLTSQEFVHKAGQKYKEFKLENDILKNYPKVKDYLKNYYYYYSIDKTALTTEKEQMYFSIKQHLSTDELRLADSFKQQKDNEFVYDIYVKSLLAKKGISVKKSFPNLYRYYSYLDASDKIDKSKLFENISRYIYDIKYNLAKTAEEKDLIFIDYYLKLVKLYITNNISISQYSDFEQNKERLFEKLRVYYKGNFSLIKEKLGIMQEYYKLAIKRSEILASNLLKYEGDILPIVIGFFYTASLTENLRNRGISYKVISPYIKKAVDNKSIYLGRLNGKVIEYDMPVISSCIYTKDFRQTFADLLVQKIWVLYKNKKINNQVITKSLNYIVKVGIENQREKQVMKLIYKLVKLGYNQGYTGPYKETARSIAIKTDIEPHIIESVLDEN